MSCDTAALKTLVDIKTGAPMSRAKRISADVTATEVQVLVPAAMRDGRVIDGQLVTESVAKVKDDLFTREGDVIVKASTPYDCVYIDKEHEGILVTSFGIILRQTDEAKVSMRYLAVYMGLRQTGRELQAMSKGMTIQLIKKKDLGDLKIPLPPASQQQHLADLFESTRKRKELCLLIAEKSDQLLQSEFSRLVINSL